MAEQPLLTAYPVEMGFEDFASGFLESWLQKNCRWEEPMTSQNRHENATIFMRRIIEALMDMSKKWRKDHEVTGEEPWATAYPTISDDAPQVLFQRKVLAEVKILMLGRCLYEKFESDAIIQVIWKPLLDYYFPDQTQEQKLNAAKYLYEAGQASGRVEPLLQLFALAHGRISIAAQILTFGKPLAYLDDFDGGIDVVGCGVDSNKWPADSMAWSVQPSVPDTQPGGGPA